MQDHVYKKVEIVGSSTISVEDAIKTAIRASSESVKNMRWFEVEQVRGEIEDGEIAHYQVTLKLGFTVDR